MSSRLKEFRGVDIPCIHCGKTLRPPQKKYGDKFCGYYCATDYARDDTAAEVYCKQHGWTQRRDGMAWAYCTADQDYSGAVCEGPFFYPADFIAEHPDWRGEDL